MVGAVLMLAVAATVYAQQARTEIPRHGAEAERAWDVRLSAGMGALSQGAADGVARSAPVTVILEPPPTARSLDVPMLGSLSPARPSGILEFKTECGRFNATHRALGGLSATDLTNASRGCLELRATTTYAPPFTYRYAMGGVMRAQGDQAVVLTGPPLELRMVSSTEYRVGLTLPTLTGAAQSTSVDRAGAKVDLLLSSASLDPEPAANARNVTWTLDTPYPVAWRDWLQAKFVASGFVASRASPGAGESSADYVITCANGCTTTNGLGRVTVVIEGPRTDANDIRYSLSTGAFSVALR